MSQRTNMDWHFPQSDPAGEANINSYSRTVIEGERTISALEIFVREVLQNSLDAAMDPSSKVTVQFRLRTLSGGSLTSFFQAINWPSLKKFADAASRVSGMRMDRYRFPDSAQLERNPVRVLEISELNTIGLIGPDRMTKDEDYWTWPGQTPKSYRALCRDDARREKVSLGSGGTFGLGKAVLWRASQIQTVLFFSRLSEHFGDVTHRAAGQARLCTHTILPHEYRGIGFGGTMEGQFCAPLKNQDAIRFARNVGISTRTEATSFGTTILIPFWEQPKAHVDDDVTNTPTLLAKYAARFFWPAIEAGRLEVIAADDHRKSNASDHLLHYQPFIELFRRMQANRPDKRDASYENVTVLVPPAPPPLKRREAQTFVRCGACFINPDNAAERVSENYLGKVAEIRGRGMIIGYQKVTGNTRVKPFVGLALGGQIADPTEAGVQGDMLLGFSEHITHTRWDEDAESLDSWPNARVRVRDLLGRMRGYFIRVAGNEAPPPTGDLSALQQGLVIPGIDRGLDPDSIPRDISRLEPERFEREGDHYAFGFHARIEADASPMRLTFWVDPGVESGRPSIEDRLEIKEVSTIPSDLEITHLGNGQVQVAIPTLASATRIHVSGMTAEVPSEVLAVTEGRLYAKIKKQTEPEDRDPEPSGELTHAES